MRSYLARFAFRGDEVFAPISGLSGGEKGRLTLAVVMRQRHNLLLLDEPTNHLDLDSREALEESLDDFPGSIVFVSHDRAFIDRLATRVLDLRGGRRARCCRATTRRRRRRERSAAGAPEPADRAGPAPAARAAGAPRRDRPPRQPRGAARATARTRRDQEAARRRRSGSRRSRRRSPRSRRRSSGSRRGSGKRR